MSSVFRIIGKWASAFFFLSIISAIVALQLLHYVSKDLPDYKQLKEYDPPTITRIYSSDGNVIAQYAKERRIYTDFEDIPKIVINAFLAAEDKKFFDHHGIDLISITRATAQSVLNLAQKRRAVGASTITQQVVRNFLLTNERTITRKIKEAILAYRISNFYSKERILELYLNQIFLGNNSYGIAAAARNYFNKELEDLDIAEAAMLAALPKAPSSLNPFSHYDRAKARRNWVIERMAEEKMITNRQAAEFSKEPINLLAPRNTQNFGENFYMDAVKQELINMFGEEDLYSKGFMVNTYLNEDLQRHVDESFINGLLNYDKKHGWRGSLERVDHSKDWILELRSFKKPVSSKNFELAVVLGFNKDNSTKIGLQNGEISSIPFNNLKWARKRLAEQDVGAALKSPRDVLSKGDVILVSVKGNKHFLQQIPDIDGGMVVMEPYSGAVLAMAGGYDFGRSYFNRVTQAKRQSGSVFKPFVYLAALEEHFSPNDIILDEQISISRGENLPPWEPKNYGDKYLGAITIRTALERSRNMPAVRLIIQLGIDKVKEVARRLHINDDSPNSYTIALGAADTTLLNITNAYNTVASNGQLTKPRLIESIYNRRGKLIYSDYGIRCIGCMETTDNIGSRDVEPPKINYSNQKVIEDDTNYQLISMLEGDVKRGTAVRARALNKTVAGKTGTTNDSRDAWFIGFTPYLTTGVYLGFDAPRTMGKHETGASSALPIFVDFMKKAAKDVKNTPFPIPDSIELKPVDRTSGEIIYDEENSFIDKKNIIMEAFKRERHSAPKNMLINRSLNKSPQYDLSEILDSINEEEEEVKIREKVVTEDITKQ